MENSGGLLGGSLTDPPPLPPVSGLANNDWDTIIDIANQGKAQDYWNLGETITIPVGNEQLEFAIVGFNHDDKSDKSGKANITFGMTGLMANGRIMNSVDTNVGSFVSTDMYSYLRDEVLPSMPQKLQNAIKPVDKITSVGGESSELQTDSMSLWLFSAYEIGHNSVYIAKEGTPYEWYYSFRIKERPNAWWLRSPGINSDFFYCWARSTGDMGGSTRPSGREYGVCFGFCI